MQISTALEGAVLVAIGAFVVFAPHHADRLARAAPFIRLGHGRTRFILGCVLLVVGIAIIAASLLAP
jgi:hypothetical protein